MPSRLLAQTEFVARPLPPAADNSGGKFAVQNTHTRAIVSASNLRCGSFSSRIICRWAGVYFQTHSTVAHAIIFERYTSLLRDSLSCWKSADHARSNNRHFSRLAVAASAATSSAPNVMTSHYPWNVSTWARGCLFFLFFFVAGDHQKEGIYKKKRVPYVPSRRRRRI